MPKRRGIFRTKFRRAGKLYYVKRDKNGRFADMQSLKRTVPRERASKSKTRVKWGYGFRGETKKGKKK